MEGPYSARAISSTEIISNYPAGSGSEHSGTGRRWTLQGDISSYPQLKSDYLLVDALYKLSLSELVRDTRFDGAFNAGAKWEGVWTRDVSYSILLSLAAIQPDAARASLLHKVNRGRIVQDTGTGGSWPVSTDRVTWSLAAWEIYLVTGDRKWLQESYTIIRDSILDDEQVVLDPATGLAHGESSFMDWREQTYPRWMEPVDIYSSENLGTNAVYYRTYRILASMATELGLPSEGWNSKADRIRSALNDRLWVNRNGYYGEYLYGRTWQTLSPRSDALGEALSIIFEIADASRQDAILRSQPLMPFGIPTVFPETPGIPPYHNRSVWPFVQAFWNLAAAKRANGPALLSGLAGIYRASALFLTNKENFVAETGSPEGTVINSDRQLWSVAGNLAMTYRVFFGMNFDSKGLEFHPVIPEAFQGTRILTNFRYRKAILSITIKGFGAQVKSATLDGKPGNAAIPTGLEGHHQITIQMNNLPLQTTKLNIVSSEIAPDTPLPQCKNGVLSWKSVTDAARYEVYKNGVSTEVIDGTSAACPGGEDERLTQYQVAALNQSGTASFLSEPTVASDSHLTISAVPSSGESYITLDSVKKNRLSVAGDITREGRYGIAFRYANGNGPVNTDNKCAIRTLFVDGKEVGPIILPQRGQNDWNNWGMTNAQQVQLDPGTHQFELRFLQGDENMNVEVNQARVASIQVFRLD